MFLPNWLLRRVAQQQEVIDAVLGDATIIVTDTLGVDKAVPLKTLFTRTSFTKPHYRVSCSPSVKVSFLRQQAVNAGSTFPRIQGRYR